ncbi:hypothetical protein [Maridesulfovibrio ferrireducens]|uniref:HD domain-containing protein n=1 Tax=Maridesulfovibrio ferrireducens TaxID=246191 RepID=UPI001A2B25A8|nr:hypothetical protein [Maridesulfovibrio ferrireducens]MBI9112387.1 hypothetical protein [Maridesulfovibrio ferrireducens]
MQEQFLLYEVLSPDQRIIVDAVKKHCSSVMDFNPRFSFFTLHGSTHIENLVTIANNLIDGGIKLQENEAFYLYLSICLHDIGMTIPLKDLETKSVFKGLELISDPTYAENFIRENHHDLIDEYVASNFSFLASLDIAPSTIAIVKEICRAHRRVNLGDLSGHEKNVGALLRLIDELDIGPSRAPISTLNAKYKEMDSTSCWHWFKHNITQDWQLHHNMRYFTRNNKKSIEFIVVVSPPQESSIPYWLKQCIRPLQKVLDDEKVSSIIDERWNTKITIRYGSRMSKKNYLGDDWNEIEQIALSSGKKTILLIDDESRKMEDLFLPLMENYHIMYSVNAKDAFTKLAATQIDLAIVDMQIGSGDLWSAQETQNCKTTGVNICNKILTDHPTTQIGVLTGTRHEVEGLSFDKLAFFCKKPIQPSHFEKRVNDVLR